jgi:hypothetical protein
MLGFRVMAFVQKAVARLYEPEKLETLLQDLGKKHFAYGAKQKYVDVSSSHWTCLPQAISKLSGYLLMLSAHLNRISCTNVLLPHTGKLLLVII